MRSRFFASSKNKAKAGFVRSVSVLAGGAAAGQIIVIAASPVLTRLYSPEDFGLLAVYGAVLAILGVIASMRYQLAIPLPENDREAASVAILSLLAVIATTLITSALTYFFGPQVVTKLNAPDLAKYIWLVPLGLFLVGIYQVLQYWAIRKNEFGNIARTRVTQSIGMVATQIGGHAFGPLALLLGRIVGQSSGVVALFRSALQQNKEDFLATTPSSMKRCALEYRKFPTVSIWTGLASSAGGSLPPILIAGLFGIGSAGVFSLAQRVLSQPMLIVGRAVGDVFYRQAAGAHRDGTLGQTVERVYSGMTALALPPALVGFLILPELFVVVFGESWREAGDAGRWMVPWLFFQLVVTPSTRVYPILGLHGVALRFQLSLLCSSVVSILLGAWLFGDLVTTIALISTINSCVYVWRAVYTFRLVGFKKKVPFTILFRIIPWAVLCSFPIFILMMLYGGVFEGGAASLILIAFSCLLFVIYGKLNIKKVFS